MSPASRPANTEPPDTVLHCAANRHPDDVDLGSVGIVLDAVSLVDLTRGDLLTAGDASQMR